MDFAAVSRGAEIGAGVPARDALYSAAISDATYRAGGGAGFVVEQGWGLEEMAAGGGDGSSVPSELRRGAMAVCEFSDVAGGAESFFRDGLLCVF